MAGIATFAHADTDQRVAHGHLLDLDLAGLTQANKPDWRVPAAMARSEAISVYVHRPLREVEGGYSLAAVYVWKNDDWRPVGWRMMHPSVAGKWSEERVLSDPAQLPGKDFSVDVVSEDERGLLSENDCTDAPDSRGPDSAHGHIAGDTVINFWINESQGCEYETEYRVQELADGRIGWVMIDFRFTLQNGDGDDDGA
ncbi:MAG: hypothetical protein U5L08_14260 [Xanthomonadales bacterium]|nr:hypothetical protein [Xanthomonadales bacterium]